MKKRELYKGLDRGLLTEGQILRAVLIRNRLHEHRNRSVIVSNRRENEGGEGVLAGGIAEFQA